MNLCVSALAAVRTVLVLRQKVSCSASRAPFALVFAVLVLCPYLDLSMFSALFLFWWCHNHHFFSSGLASTFLRLCNANFSLISAFFQTFTCAVPARSHA